MTSWGIILFLVLDFLVSTPKDPYGFGKWSWNLFYDFMYLRIGGPFLYGNHVVTGLAICAVPIYYCIREGYSRAPIWLCCTLGMVFFHEVVLQAFGSFVYGWNLVGYQLVSYYILILAGFTALAFIFGNRFQRKTLIIILLICVITSGITMALYGIFDYKPLVLIGFKPGPQVLDFWANFEENLLWWIPISVWFWWRR
jgi:hypothetical protein